MGEAEEVGGFLEDFLGCGEGGCVIGILEMLLDVGVEHVDFFFCLLLLVPF